MAIPGKRSGDWAARLSIASPSASSFQKQSLIGRESPACERTDRAAAIGGEDVAGNKGAWHGIRRASESGLGVHGFAAPTAVQPMSRAVVPV